MIVLQAPSLIQHVVVIVMIGLQAPSYIQQLVEIEMIVLQASLIYSACGSDSNDSVTSLPHIFSMW